MSWIVAGIIGWSVGGIFLTVVICRAIRRRELMVPR